MDGLEQWKCRNGHVLGVKQRVKENGYSILRLMVFRHAINLAEGENMEDVDVLTTIEGTSYDLKCDIPGCNAHRTWYMGRDIKEMVAMMYVPE